MMNTNTYNDETNAYMILIFFSLILENVRRKHKL